MIPGDSHWEIILFGGLSDSSFIRENLRISTCFSLFLHQRFVYSDPGFELPGLPEGTKFVHVDQPPPRSPEEAREFLKTRSTTKVILWPAVQIPQSKNDLIAIWPKLLKTPNSFLQLGEHVCYHVTASGPIQKVGDINSLDLSADASNFDSLNLSSPPRHYNRIERSQNGLMKICSDIAKGQAEFFFYQNLPSELAPYYPRVLSHSENPNSFAYEIEKFNLLEISRYVIHHSLSQNEWRELFDRLKKYIETCPKIKVSATEYQKQLQEYFINKLLARLQIFTATHPDYATEVSWSKDLVAALSDCIHSSSSAELRFSHGDLCFSNILYSVNSGELKLVDPRGASDSKGLFMPMAYDLSKLSHSIFGGYDRIMARLPFQSDESKNSAVGLEFLKLLHGLNVDYRLIRLGEASLFLSMLPLHVDQPELWGRLIRAAKDAFASAAELKHVV